LTDRRSLQGGYLCTGCGASCQIFTAAKGIFSDGSPGPYEHNSDCNWIIAPTAAGLVTITFTLVDTERDYDFIRVFTCTDINCEFATRRLLAKLSGTQSGSYTSTSGYMLIIFTSDTSISGGGFEASWTSEAQVCIIFSCISRFVGIPQCNYMACVHGLSLNNASEMYGIPTFEVYLEYASVVYPQHTHELMNSSIPNCI
jgi:hypothetical protein